MIELKKRVMKMVEDIGKIIINGFETYTKNLNLCVPFILNVFITGLLTLIMFGIGFFLIFFPYLASFKEGPRPSLLSLLPFITQHIWEIIFIIAIIFLIIMLVDSFIMAGAIGMAKQATETGKSKLSTMMDEGKKNFVNLFLAEILVGLLSLAGIVLMVPGAMKIDFTDFTALTSPKNTDAIILLAGGFILWIVYLLIIGITMAVFMYALVVDNLGPIESITTSFGFFKKNWVDVILLLLIVIAIGVVFFIIDWIMAFIPIINIIWPFVSFLISILILQPLYTIWWIRLYMTRTDKKIYINDLLAHPNDLKNP